MGKFKRYLATILAFALIVSVFPLDLVKVFADDELVGVSISVVGEGSVAVKDSKADYLINSEEVFNSELMLGDELSLKFTPNEGYELKDVIINQEICEVVEDTLNYVVSSSNDIKVTFSKVEIEEGVVEPEEIESEIEEIKVDSKKLSVFEGSMGYTDIESFSVKTRTAKSLGYNEEFFVPASVGDTIKDAFLYTPYEDGTLESGESLDLSMYRNNKKVRSVGDTTYIVKGDSFAYNGWSTSEYSVLVGSTTYLGVCAEPSKASPTGYYTVSALNDDVIKAMLYAFQDEGYRKSIFGDTAYHQQFINMHTTIGYRYSGDLKGADSGTISGAKNVIKFMEEVFIPGHASELSACTAYVAVTNNQDIVWLEKATSGKLQIHKVSTMPEMTNGLDCYSMEGTVYGVFSDSACTIPVWEFTIGADGKSDIATLPMGTYYIKETKALDNWYLDENVYTAMITSSHVTTPLVVSSKEDPKMDPVMLLLKKKDAKTGTTESMVGAEFTFKYYDVIDVTVDPETLGYTPTREWVFKTDEDGFINYHKDFFVSGDELYVGPTGNNLLPAGTLTIQETKAPEGYLLNKELFVVPIKYNETEGVITHNIREVPEEPLSLQVLKIDPVTDKPLEGVTFTHVDPDGKKVEKVTGKDGIAKFDYLAYGIHTIKEVKTIDGYHLNRNEIRFEVKEDNKIVILSQVYDPEKEGNITINITDTGSLEAVVENRPIPFSLQIHKVNEKDVKLPSAEFTLYSDEECTKVVEVKETGSEGTLVFEDVKIGETYYLKETKAPAGYKLKDGEVYKITAVYEDGVFTFNVNDEEFSTSDTDATKNIYYSKESSTNVVNIKVLNKTGILLPDTGSGWMIPLMVVGVGVMVAGLVLSRKKKIKE